MSDLIAEADTAANFLQELMMHQGQNLGKAVHADVWATRETIIKMAGHIKELEEQKDE